MLVEDVGRRLYEAGATKDAPYQSWEIKTDRGRLTNITFTSDFPSNVPIHQLRMGDPFGAMLRVYPEAGVVVSAKSASGRPFYLVPLPAENAELLVELGQRNELVKLTLMPSGRFREYAPEHWQKMTEFMERRSAKRSEDLRRAPELTARREQQRAAAARNASISDPDQQLDAWAEHTLIWGKVAPWLKSYAAWLRAGSPHRWHDAAQNWNWDYGIVPLRWIATRGDCDRATALVIFFAGEPVDTPETGEVAELQELIRERWAAGSYSMHGIEFKLPSYMRTMAADRDVDRVPLAMRVTLDGEAVPTIDYVDGVPAFLLPSEPTNN
jgi:hypothetical protein